MKTPVWTLLATTFLTLSVGQQVLLGQNISSDSASPTDSTAPFPLWSTAAPGALGTAEKDIPTLTPFLPESGKANGSAMVICPGGGYVHLAPHEGEGYARWLAFRGVTCFVLKYRLGGDGYRYPVELQDGARAIRLVRARAKAWNVDPNRIGIIGSSAGGHLASMVMTHFDAGNSNSTDVIERVSSRPNVAILCYPVVSMGQFAHQGSKNNLLGENPSAQLVEETSSELQVTKDSPPCFIWHTDEDTIVPIENSLQFGAALRKANVPFELHVYQRGGHGAGLGSKELNPQKWLPWVGECERWLKEQGILK